MHAVESVRRCRAKSCVFFFVDEGLFVNFVSCDEICVRMVGSIHPTSVTSRNVVYLLMLWDVFVVLTLVI